MSVAGIAKRELTFREVLRLMRSGWPFVLIFLSSITGFITSGVQDEWIWITLGLAIALLTSGTVGALFVKPSYLDLLRIKEQFDESALARQATYQETLRSHLRDLLTELGLLSADTRASAYFHNGNAFVMIARYSSNPSHMKSGRSIYPQDQGLISVAWQEGEACKIRLPADASAYARKVLDLYEVPIAVTEEMTMRSRSLAGLRVSADRDPIGVIILESTEPQRVSQSVLSNMKQSSAWRAASDQMSTSRDNLPDMLGVSEEGF